MMQHHKCLYCGKDTDTGFNCYCPESRLTVTFPKESPLYKYRFDYVPPFNMTNKEIKPLYKQDLLSVARELPKMEGVDHEQRVLWHFGKGQWSAVDQYVDYVIKYHKLRPVLKPTQTRREKIIEFVRYYATEMGKWLTGLINRLKQITWKIKQYYKKQ